MARIRRKITKTGAQPRKRERKVVELTDAQIEKKRREDEALAKQLSSVVHHIIAPAGIPPYDLEGDDLESIKAWVEQIKKTGPHTVQSCQYWVKYFYDFATQKQQWQDVRQKILDNHLEWKLPNIAMNTKSAIEIDEDSDEGLFDSVDES
jgi:hypothetical protein